MTLILSAYANGWSFQASDRRLTMLNGGRDAELAYEFANKSMILRTRDAVVTIGFTGVAHIQGIATDQWLAQRLVKDVRNAEGRVCRGLGRRRLHEVVAQLRTELTAAVAATRTPRGGNLLLRLVFAGQRWDRKSPRRFSPLSFAIDTRRVGGLTVSRVTSDHLRSRWFSGLDPQVVFSADTPTGTEYWLNQRMRSGAPRTREGFRQFLVDALRRVATASRGTVGEDCMLVEFLPRLDGWTRAWVEFFPASAPTPFLRAAGNEFPLTFTPAVLTPYNYLGPGVQNMDSVVPPVEVNVLGLDEARGLPFAGYRDDLQTPALHDLVERRRTVPRHWEPPHH